MKITKMSLFGKKKKFIQDESGMSTLDNSAPVRSILEHLYNKNPPAHKLYCQVAGRRPAQVRGTHCCLVGHALAAFPDAWSGDLPLEYFAEWSYGATLPRMLLAPRHAGRPDPVVQLLVAKEEWSVMFQRMMAISQSAKNVCAYSRLSEQVSRCARHYVNMAAQLQAEPSPHFRSHYNWQYAGAGTLRTVSLAGAPYLLHAELVCLHVSRVGADGLTPDMEETSTFHCGDNVLEICCSADDSLVALRTSNKVILLLLTVAQGIHFEILKTFKSKDIYTSVEFDAYHQTVLYLTKINDTVDIVNLNTLQIKSLALSGDPRMVDNWNSVLGFDRLHFVHATTQAVHVFDKRTNKKAFSMENHKKVCDDCNDITLVRKSRQLQHCFYLGTNHHLFCLDARSMRAVKPKLLTRWTHGMRSPPTLATLNEFEIGKEAVFLSSQWPEDVTVIINDTAHLKAELPPSSAFLPYRLPSVFDSLRSAQSNKLCLDPTLLIERRLSTALTGLSVCYNDGRFDIITHNSLGDLSACTLYPQHHEGYVDAERLERLDAWAERLRAAPRSLAATQIFNVSKLWAYSKCSNVHESRLLSDARDRSNYTEEAVVEILDSDNFDKDLLDAWNLA